MVCLALAALAMLPIEDNLKIVTEFQPVSADSDAFLERPSALAIDARGRILMLDVLAKTVFVWNADGSFAGNFGREGEGPGEFSFSSNAARQGFLFTYDERVYVHEVYDQRLHIFDQNHRFIKTQPFDPAVGRVRRIGVNQEGKLALHLQDYNRTQPYSALLLLDSVANDKVVATFMPYFHDGSYKMTQLPSGRYFYEINAYTPEPFIYASPDQKWVLVGENSAPEFALYDSDGEIVKRIKLPLKRHAVNDADIEEYEQTPFMKLNVRRQVNYPDVMPFYDFIYPIGNQGFLVGLMSPAYGRVRATVVDRDGAEIRKLHLVCGENGRLFGSRGRLFLLKADDWGEYSLQEMALDW